MKDRGFVLVNVLILIAALSVVAVGLLQITARATQRMDVAQGAAQAPLIIDAGVAFAASLLAADGVANSIDHKGEAWALRGFLAETALGPVRVTVTDLESRININRPLASDGVEWEAPMRDLLIAEGGSADLAAALTVRYARMRADEPTPDNRDPDTMHQRGDLTHLAALNGLADQGAADAVLSGVVFAALPRDRGVNINTADDRVLAALPRMTPEVLAGLNAARQADPIADDTALAALLQQIAPVPSVMEEILETQSHWFVVETETQINGLTYRGKTILVRQPATGDIRVHFHKIKVTG